MVAQRCGKAGLVQMHCVEPGAQPAHCSDFCLCSGLRIRIPSGCVGTHTSMRLAGVGRFRCKDVKPERVPSQVTCCYGVPMQAPRAALGVCTARIGSSQTQQACCGSRQPSPRRSALQHGALALTKQPEGSRQWQVALHRHARRRNDERLAAMLEALRVGEITSCGMPVPRPSHRCIRISGRQSIPKRSPVLNRRRSPGRGSQASFERPAQHEGRQRHVDVGRQAGAQRQHGKRSRRERIHAELHPHNWRGRRVRMHLHLSSRSRCAPGPLVSRSTCT